MIDNLEEAIAHAKEVAENWKSQLVNCVSDEGRNKCLECAKDHELLAEWLTELQERREADRWNIIETEEDNPKAGGFYLTTAEMLSELEGKMKYITAENYFTLDFGGQWVDCANNEYNVIAWKPLPKPYTESEDT